MGLILKGPPSQGFSHHDFPMSEEIQWIQEALDAFLDIHLRSLQKKKREVFFSSWIWSRDVFHTWGYLGFLRGIRWLIPQKHIQQCIIITKNDNDKSLAIVWRLFIHKQANLSEIRHVKRIPKNKLLLIQPKGHEIKVVNVTFPTKYPIPKRLKVSRLAVSDYFKDPQVHHIPQALDTFLVHHFTWFTHFACSVSAMTSTFSTPWKGSWRNVACASTSEATRRFESNGDVSPIKNPQVPFLDNSKWNKIRNTKHCTAI